MLKKSQASTPAGSRTRKVQNLSGWLAICAKNRLKNLPILLELRNFFLGHVASCNRLRCGGNGCGRTLVGEAKMAQCKKLHFRARIVMRLRPKLALNQTKPQ